MSDWPIESEAAWSQAQAAAKQPILPLSRRYTWRDISHLRLAIVGALYWMWHTAKVDSSTQ